MLPERAFQRGFDGRILPQGGKGSTINAPAPDPSIGASQVALSNTAQQQADLASQEYKDFKDNVWPTMAAQSQSQLDASNRLAAQQYDINTQNQAIATAYNKRMTDVFYPMQDKLIAEANNYNTDANREQIASSAIGDVTQAFDNQRTSQNAQARSYGIDPTSGAYQGMERATGVSEAATQASAATRARDAALQLGWAKSMDAIGLGSGLAGNQATSTSLALQAGNSSLAAGQVPMQNASALGSSYAQGYGGANSGYGGAASSYGAAGNLGAQSYGTQVSAWNAQQQANAQSSAGIGSALGGILGGAAKGIFSTGGYFAPGVSDIRLKENIEVVGMTDSGLTIYEFEYKPAFKNKPNAGHGRFRGVMAHEVERVIPSAVFTTPDGYKAVDYSQVI